ncbi:MAG: hypothetical protein HY720_12145 [Planctomycetes bacterium]|nr:hypothetical protein [Planctomycetota bacterium]
MAVERREDRVNVGPGEEEWRIARPQTACVRCGKVFAPGEAFQSGAFRETAELVRRDYCLPCWGVEPPAAFASWRTSARSPEEKPRPLDLALLVDLLARLAALGKEEDLPLAFCLALYLSRKKKVVLDGTRREPAGSVLVYRVRDDEGATIALREPLLSEEELDRAERRLSNLLGSGALEPGPLSAGSCVLTSPAGAPLPGGAPGAEEPETSSASLGEPASGAGEDGKSS